MRIQSRTGEYAPTAEVAVILTPADIAVITAALANFSPTHDDASRVCYELTADFERVQRDLKILSVI